MTDTAAPSAPAWDEATWRDDWGSTGDSFVWDDPAPEGVAACGCGNRAVVKVDGIGYCPACVPFTAEGERIVARARWKAAVAAHGVGS